MSTAQRKLFTEIGILIDKTVQITTTQGETYTGTLTGVNPETLTVSLTDAKAKKGIAIHKAIINGNTIANILAIERPFDLKALAERLDKVFPTMVKLYEDKGFIWVMDKIKVTEKGITEGTGPAAERVQRVYDQFLAEAK
jgi:Small nuclear ribonucleoprotein (snRNP) homolog